MNFSEAMAAIFDGEMVARIDKTWSVCKFSPIANGIDELDNIYLAPYRKNYTVWVKDVEVYGN